MKVPTRSSLAALVITILIVTGTTLPAAAEPMALGDVLKLLQAGIGTDLVLMQVERTGTYLDLDVNDLIALRRAGADDDLLAVLMDEPGTRTGPPILLPAETGENVRVFVDAQRDGRPTIVLTNLDEEGRRLDGAPIRAIRGVISSSVRGGTLPPAPVPTEPAAAVAPTRMEITLRSDPGDQRLARLEDRLSDLESPEPDRPPVGAGLPRHPINDFREYPVVPYGYSLGFGYGIPVLSGQEFTVTRYGSLPSFTSAAAAGVNPFKPVQGCVHGQACSIHQRLAQP